MDAARGSPFILIFQALPIIVVMGSISMILFHTGILPMVVRGLSTAMERTKIIGGGLATALSGKIFLGQTDTPLLVRPYLDHFSPNELLSLMTMGMATSVSTIFLLYSNALSPVMDQGNVLIHLATSTFINIIAALIIAECIRPQKGPMTSGTCTNPYVFQSIMQAIARGATDGWNIMMMIGAMMIAMIALIDIANGLFGQLVSLITGTTMTIQQVLGYVLSPLVWCMGISWSECIGVGALLAEKTVLNEWVPIANIVKGTYGVLSPRALPIILYSLCAFSNISSIGIQIACLGAYAPSRLQEIVHLAPLALLASLLAGALSSAIVSCIL
jgi:CNT family concentrative nucleoside transporter